MFSRKLPCWCLPSFLPWGDLGRLYRSPTQRSWQCATGRRCRLSIMPTPSLPGAVSHGSTFTETKFTPVTVARAGLCSTSSLLQAHHHLPSCRPQHRQDPAQPQQRQEGIKQHHAARSSLLGPAPPGFVSYAQHHWLAYWNSRQRQRTTAPQQCETDLFRPAYHVRRNTAVNSPRPPTPPVYHHCVPRDLYPRETLV